MPLPPPFAFAVLAFFETTLFPALAPSFVTHPSSQSMLDIELAMIFGVFFTV